MGGCLGGAGDGDASPGVVPVVVRGAGNSYAGVYEPVKGERVNGMPLWRRSSEPHRWMYSDPDRRWRVTDDRGDFEWAGGWLWSLNRHKGRLPQDVAEWAQKQAGGEDPLVSVVPQTTDTPRCLQIAGYGDGCSGRYTLLDSEKLGPPNPIAPRATPTATPRSIGSGSAGHQTTRAKLTGPIWFHEESGERFIFEVGGRR
eukprot:Hpha_TRINITY_DN25021_c0_g1::TRINITY_DN25021_c0_g1_i1::g.109703::m.109703